MRNNTNTCSNILKVFLPLLGILYLTSCKSAREVLYLQDLEHKHSETLRLVEPKIQPGDMLGISVNAQNNELAAPFNLPVLSYTGTQSRGVGVQHLQGYLVSNRGVISFPLLGSIQTTGLSTSELAEKIRQEIIRGNYIKDPVVTVSYQNFKISILGEVNRPGSYAVQNERISIFDALGLAGDMTIYGRRDNVIVLREVNGTRETFVQDLRSKEVFNSPCFYLAQNDIVIVNPNETKIQMGGINQNNNVGVWLSLVGSVTSVSTFVMTIVRNSQSKN